MMILTLIGLTGLALALIAFRPNSRVDSEPDPIPVRVRETRRDR